MEAGQFLRNHWYAVSRNHEVNQTPLGRTVCSEPIVFCVKLPRHSLRSRTVVPAACCHFQGLTKGRPPVSRYHGLEFKVCGQCVCMPSQQGVHQAARLRVYPAVEKHRFVWVWVGDDAASARRVTGGPQGFPGENSYGCEEAKDRAKPEQKRLTTGQSHNKLCSEPVPYVADSSARKHFGEAQRLLYFFSSQWLESKMARVHGT